VELLNQELAGGEGGCLRLPPSWGFGVVDRLELPNAWARWCGGDLPLIVATEKTIIEGDLERYANSPMMVSSLRTALIEIAAIEKHIAIVDDPARYQAVNEAHSLPRNRRGDLPYDEARQALASHDARLNNMDKARSEDDEKQFIAARRAAFKEAGKLYALRQARTLGI